MSDRIEERIGVGLKALGLTLAVAESCTGGLVGSRITDIPGSSDYFLGGVIAYSNDAKKKLLGVRPETLARHGAVSEPTAREMAAGVRRAFGADIGLAVTGIAGPGGGTKEKPVGLTWLSLSAKDRLEAESILLQGDRIQNKSGATDRLLGMLEEYLTTIGNHP